MATKSPPFKHYAEWTTYSIERVLELSIPEPNSGCWLFTGGVGSHGYGQIVHNGSRTTLHRYAYSCSNGDIPKGLVVRHKCDTKLCCNPAHLELGTYKDNAKDVTIRMPERAAGRLLKTKKEIYSFFNIDGRVFTGTVNDFYTTMGISKEAAWRMVKGRRPSTFGWSINHGG